MKKPTKKLVRDKITFEDGPDREMAIDALMGQGNRPITSDRGLTQSQVTYRCAKLKAKFGFEFGLRVMWRNGLNPLYPEMRRRFAVMLQREIDRKVVPQIIHPTPKTVKIDL